MHQDLAAATDYKKVFTELIKKQIVILGPNITLARVKSVAGLEVNDAGEVTKIEGDPQMILQNLINQFVELSGLIVKKTMESILTNYAGLAAMSNMGQAMNPMASMQTQAPQANPAPVMQAAAAPVASQPLESQPSTGQDFNKIEDLNKLIQQINSSQ